MQVRREVTVTDAEPRLVAEACDRVEPPEGVAAQPPAALFVHLARERVGDNVRVRRDVQTVEPFVVAGVDDRREALLRDSERQRPEEARAADAAA